VSPTRRTSARRGRFPAQLPRPLRSRAPFRPRRRYRRIRQSLALALMAASTGAAHAEEGPALPGGPGQEREWQKGGLVEVSLESLRAEHVGGQPLELRLQVKNVGPKPVVLQCRLAHFWDYYVDVFDDSGTAVVYTAGQEIPRLPNPSRDDYVVLPPGHFVGKDTRTDHPSIRLGPGKYYVEACFTPAEPGKDASWPFRFPMWHGAITSLRIPVAVVSR